MTKIGGWLLGSLGLLGTCLAACGHDGAAADEPPSVKSGSFSPTSGVTATGEAATELWWKYRMNGGVGIPIAVNGASGTLRIGDSLTRIADGGTKRVVTFDLALTVQNPSGPVTSNAMNEVDDTLMAGPPNVVVSEQIQQTQHLSSQGMALTLGLNELIMPAMPELDFSDRTDLDQLPVGHADGQQVRVEVTATATADGTSNTQTQTADQHIVWTVMAQIPSMVVLDKTYQHVVEVLVTTESTDASTLMTTSATQTRWLAAGVGTIKSKGDNPLVQTVLTSELIDTNLGLM